MGLDPLELEVKSINGTPDEKLAAARIQPMLAQHHLLLATLLLGNAICFETLPIFMDAIMPSWMAILISTTFILVFGEVVPQALCVGPNQLQIASMATPIVRIIMYIFMPVTYFIAKYLDWLLGTHGERRYDRKMLIGIVGLHASKRTLLSPSQN
jgi:metal transporter CNNM